ncbi:hypothetical protein CASFOL_033128 [Castilleja foliolosa]|uniref:F-box domain-containing protein n=1 Tax=Castilleja foliolosa TaxID=1961234 RepID=A0ABD3C442_9LAMI
MELNRKENLCCDVKFEDGYFMEKLADVKRKNFIDFKDSESDEGDKDIADLLPNDPFEMELNIDLPNDPFVMGFEISLPGDPFGIDIDIDANLKAITGWIEEFGNQASGDKNVDDNKLFTELNFFWTSSTKYDDEEEDNELVGEIEEQMCFGCEKYKNLDADEGGHPPAALFFVLGYLGVKDLLSFERVCKSLRDAVRDETPVWKNIQIDCTLSDKITDDGLLRLTNRAKGTLCSLSLVKCLKITNTGLKHVLESNPGLTKLSVQGCNKLNIEVILHDLKAFNSVAKPGIKHLRVGQLSGLTNQHFKEFKLLLGVDEDKKPVNYKPRFFRVGELDLSLDDERAIDIETCPRCEQAREVYDCPSESCQEKCRGCAFCISRCVSCGCCLDNKEYEETFCLDSLCLDCLDQLLNCKDRHTYFHQKASYHFFLCGKAT